MIRVHTIIILINDVAIYYQYYMAVVYDSNGAGGNVKDITPLAP